MYKYFFVLPSLELRNVLTRRFSITDCIMIYKNPEVPARATSQKLII